MIQTTKRERKEGPPGTEVRPFSVHIAAFVGLLKRIAVTCWPERETVADQCYGRQLATIRVLARHGRPNTTGGRWRRG
jgi:hypothetical protein